MKYSSVAKKRNAFKGVFLLLFLFAASYVIQAQNQKVTLPQKQVTILSAFEEIEKQTGMNVAYNEATINVSRSISVDIADKTLTEALTAVLKGTNATFRIQGKQIMIVPITVEISVKKYSGTVSDDKGEPIIGASVALKGSSTGTVTNVDGKFSIEAPLGSTLSISYLGFITQEIKLGENTSLQIAIQEDEKLLDEIVVIGYGIVKKSDLTGAVASISSKSFKNEPVKQIYQILQGRSAGVQVMNLSGMIGSGAKVRIRGTTSINKGSDPLYVIDGFVGGSMDALNPDDIQSVEILKDASATAIYGSRGANGVVLVTTKNGQDGKTQVQASVDVGVSNILKKYDLLNAYEYAEALNDYKGANTISAADMEAYRSGEKGIDWQELMLQTGVSQDYKLQFSGGSTRNKYLVSANLLDMSAMTITSKYQRGQFRVNLDNELTSWLTASTKLNAARTKAHNNSIGIMQFLNYSPTMEMKDEETGIYNRDPFNANNTNPYGLRMENYNDNYGYLLNGNMNLLFNIMNGLTLSVQAVANYGHYQSYSFDSKLVTPGAINSMSNGSSTGISWQNTNNLTYDKTFGDHHLTATAVWEASSSESRNLAINGSNLNNEFVGYWNYKNAVTRDGSNGYSAESLLSGLGRLMYNYKGRYMLTGTFRADGSSKFQNKKWGYFPSGALAWDVAKESFLNDLGIFQQLKMRASFGITGNQAIDRYSTLGMLSQTTREGFGMSTSHIGYWSNSFATPDVTWESTYQYNVGLDVGVLKGQLNFTLEYFRKDSKDMLFRKPAPLYNGGGSFWVNQGELKNSGFEFTATAYPLGGKTVNWETTFNASYVRNEVVDLAGNDFVIGDNWTGIGGGPITIMQVGYPLGSFYLYKWKGFNSEGANLYERTDGSLTTSPTANDLCIMGQTDPKWTFGWNNTLAWKNWTVNIFFNSAIGYNRLNVTRFAMGTQIGQYRFISLRESYYQGWDKVENKADALYPNHRSTNNKNYPDSDQWLENASFLKLKNFSISYTIPKAQAKIADVQLSISGQNVWTLTKYTGMDPEVYNDISGVDWGAYPIPRTYTFGMKLNF
jgi:TonB-linked SusC/RagA family outer membrane protein